MVRMLFRSTTAAIEMPGTDRETRDERDWQIRRRRRIFCYEGRKWQNDRRAGRGGLQFRL